VKRRIILWFGVLLLAKAVVAADSDLPHTFAELNHWYAEPPAGSNAATIFLEGFAALKITDADTTSTNLPLVGEGALLRPDKPVPSETKAAMASFIQRNRSAMVFFNQAAQLQQSRYPIDLNQGQMPQLPHLAKLRTVAQFLEISAVSHAAAGQGQAAGNDLLVSLALARSLDSEPVLISQLVRVAFVDMTVGGLEQVFNRVMLPAKTLNQLAESFQQAEKREAAGYGFTRALIGERTTDLSAFDMSPEQYLNVPANTTPEEREQLEAKIKKNLAEDRQFCEVTFNQALVVRNEPFPQRLTQEDDLFSHAETVATNKNLYLSGIFFDALNKVEIREATCLANLRLAQTAISLEKFRVDHADHYPESLNELAPNYLKALPTDPFDGRTLQYHKAGNGYVLYSIGPNLKYDGGKRGNGQKSDIVFTVVAPKESHL